MAYLQISDYGVIGDLHTVALVGINGSIDWFCFPCFDSPSVFASLLDHEKGGKFKITPESEDVRTTQSYLPETNVLVTRFLSHEGAAEVIDFMPLGGGDKTGKEHTIIRMVNGVRGHIRLNVECDPAFNYARDEHTVSIFGEWSHFRTASTGMDLWSTESLTERNGAAVVSLDLHEGSRSLFVLSHFEPDSTAPKIRGLEWADEKFTETTTYWRKWIGQSSYSGRWREMVHRSALVLKMLTYAPTGAIIAAPTTSLPEEMGGVRNWDYRYTWIRDAAFTVYGLLRIGLTEAATQFMEWLEERCNETGPDGNLKVMYSIHGHTELTEQTLDHLDGYGGSKPVRIGNGAADQLQLDIYGELMDSVYLFNKYGTPISYDFWKLLRRMVNWVCDNWQSDDWGIWEVRGNERQFVYSKLMCWVAVDRALRLADKRSLPADRSKWLRVRDEIFMDIMENGWDESLQSFVQSYGSSTLDASTLMMPLVLFLSPTDPRTIKTLEAIKRSPDKGGLVSNGLVYRYNTSQTADGLPGEEGTFNMCTFWLVEALTRASSVNHEYLDEARLMFEHMLGYANHVGLYSEEIGPTGEALGNFPQGFTHLGLISAAFNLDRALGNRD